MKIQSFCFFLLFFVSCHTQDPPKLTIAAASSLQYVLEDVRDVFEQQTGIPSDLILGSSGKLFAQISAGAPYDIFISADMDYPQKLYEKGLSIYPPKTYAYGKLVIWSLKEEYPLNLSDFTDPKIEHISLANPRTAPYGRASWEVLQRMTSFPILQKKVVYGESIGQANQFVISGAAQVGFTAKSVVLCKELKDKAFWQLVPDSLYTPIKQGVVSLVKNGHQSAEAQRFMDFLCSEKGRSLLIESGYALKGE